MPKRKIKQIKRNYWKEEEEELLKQWAEKAKCYQWLHNRSRDIYQRKNALYTIPVIIISTITGTTNFAQDRFSDETREYVVIIIGTLSIIAGIITTIYQFLKISEINEGHRVALLSWGKFSRNVEAELTRHPLDRTEPSELIKMCKEEFNRLVEISPFISKNVLSEFNKKFKDSKFITKPEIGNTINEMNIFQMDNDQRIKMANDLNSNILHNNSKYHNRIRRKTQQMDNFSDSFKLLNNRLPTKEELNRHMRYINKEYSSNSDIDTDTSLDIEAAINDMKNNKELSEVGTEIVETDLNNINIKINDISENSSEHSSEHSSENSSKNSIENKISKKSYL